MHLTYLLICCFNFRFLLNMLCKQQPIYLNNVSRFLDCFFLKLPQFHTSNFRKVVRQHTEGMVGSTTWVLLEI